MKLLLNLVLVALAAIPRGGKITVTLDDVDTQPKFTLASSGPMLRVPPKFLELHSGRKPEEPIARIPCSPTTRCFSHEANMTI